ncbi:hypothetical protein C8A05DRAFT_32808, partial [Staphylotrichum tortipilum]
MAKMFFTGWDLWQQMTFVLAMAIVAVFCAGLGKLWRNNRLMKKQEALDVEKRARVEELRKTGIPIKRANQIPFGVRAIQSGVEVDGIWISRPTSHTELGEKLASSTTLGGHESDLQKRRRDYSEDEKSITVTTTTINLDRPGPKQSASTASIFQKLTDTESMESTPCAAGPPISQFASPKPKLQQQPPSRAAGALNEATLRKLEGQSPSRTHFDTYSPTTTTNTSRRIPNPHHHHHPRPGGQRNSAASSSADSVDSQPRSAGGASGRSYTSSSHSSKLYMMTRGIPHHHHATAPTTASGLRRWSENDQHAEEDPFSTPPAARTPSGFSALSQCDGGAYVQAL